VKWYNRIWRTAFIFHYFFSSASASAQSNKSDSIFYESADSEAINFYRQNIGDQSGLYNGSLYSGYPFQFESGTPFFGSSHLDTGSILYDGILYEHVPLLYENLKDLVIIKDNGYFIQLNNKKVKEFSIPAHQFVRLDGNSNSNKEINTGFYELLNKDSIAVLKKTVKKIMDDLSGDNVVQKQISVADHYYIKTESAVYEIKNKKDIMAIFAGKKKAIQQFIKKNKLNLGDDEAGSLIRIVSYYEQIRNQL
jgi:hypothetical protein